MKRAWKQIGSLFLVMCMVLTMLPTMAFAEAEDFGAPLGVSGISPMTDVTDSFTDPNFLAAVRADLGMTNDQRLYKADLAGVDTLNVSKKGIKNLAGIEHFSGLIYLYCSGNELEELDVSGNEELAELVCNDNKLTALDVSDNAELTWLTCSDNKLTTLDVSSNAKLQKLICHDNQLKTLTVNNPDLTFLGCVDNELETLNVGKAPALKELFCQRNLLKTLDVSNNSDLESLNCTRNDIPNENAVTGRKAGLNFTFRPQNSDRPAAPIITKAYPLEDDGTYCDGEELWLAVEFNEVVWVNSTVGTPYINLQIGSETKKAYWLDNGYDDTLYFFYTIQSNDLDEDGIGWHSPIELNGGAIGLDDPDFDDVYAELTFTPPDTSGIKVDGRLPRPTFSIRGTVKDEETGHGIPGATVDLYLQYVDPATGNDDWKLEDTIVADASGNYTFDGVSSYANYAVEARAEGYEERVEDYIIVQMERADKTGQDIELQRSGGPITYTITVTNGTASPTTAAAGDTITLTANTAPAGQQFKEWICTSGNASIIYDGMAMSWKFIMPAAAVEVEAVYEVIPYLTVLGVSVNDTNKDSITGQGISGGVSYDPTTKTLTLNNAVITSSISEVIAIYTVDDLNVKLVGQNQIGTAPSNPANREDYSVGIGINSEKSLSLTGEGSLTVYDSGIGILGVENLTIDIGGSLIVMEYGDLGLACCLKTYGVLTIERGSLNLTSYDSKGLFGGSIVINGDVITVQTQGASGHFAFNKEPSFGGTYAHRVFAGENADSAVEVTSPDALTFTASKYVRIQPEGAKIYTISFNTNGGNALYPGTLTTGADGKLSVLSIPTRSGNYRFDGWYTAASGGTQVTTSTVFNANTTIYAHWTYTGGDDSGGDSSSGGSTTTPPATPPTVSGSTATTTVTTTTGADGKAAASVPAAQVDSALKQAKEAAAKSGDAPRVEIKVNAPANATSVETTVPQAAMTAIASGNLHDMTISSPVANLTFDGAALITIAGAAAGDVKFSASRVDTANLPAAVQTLIGNRPVYEFSVTSGGNTISQFGGNVTVAVPYQLGEGEDPNAVIISFINASGNLEIVTNGRYDAATGTVVFTTDHFSKYAIGYNRIKFTDVTDSAWYADAVTFLAARGITSGTTATTFSPDATLTRGQFITLLMRAYNMAPDENTANNFSDAGNTYYTGYLAAAKRLGITSGVGGNKFAPEQAITRQEMFTMLYNALKSLGKLPEGDSGKTLADFTDSGDVEPWATEAMTALAKSGTIAGSGGKLDPTGRSTRAQMAQVLYNLLGE